MSDAIKDRIRGLISVGALPLTLSLAVLLPQLTWWLGIDDGFIAVTGTVLVCALLILGMQRLHPAVPAWSRWRADAGIDLLHMFLSTGASGEAVRALLFGSLYAGAAALTGLLGATAWPADLPLLVQLALALLVSDLLAYWIHRLSHTHDLLWRFHALHHSSERLYTFSSGRNHPLHTALTYSAQMTPLILLGAPPKVLALASAFTAVHGMLQHANIAFRPGPLNQIFATADLHRWHHSVDLEESRSNYGNNLIIWDTLFGTRFLPSDRDLPDRVGLGTPHFPTDYLGQLASPWTLRG